MATIDTSVAIGILQAAIVAIPFWLTSTQYWLRQSYDPGDSRFRLPSAFLGTSNAVGLLALLLAVRYSTDAVLADARDDVIIAIRLIDQCPNCGIENTVKLPDGDCEVVRGSSGDIPSSGAFTCEGVDHWPKPDRGEGCGAEFSVNVDHDAYGDSNSL